MEKANARDLVRGLPRCQFCGGPNFWGNGVPCTVCVAARLHAQCNGGKCDCEKPILASDGHSCRRCLGQLKAQVQAKLERRGVRRANKANGPIEFQAVDNDLAAKRRATALKAVATRRARLAAQQ